MDFGESGNRSGGSDRKDRRRPARCGLEDHDGSEPSMRQAKQNCNPADTNLTLTERIPFTRHAVALRRPPRSSQSVLEYQRGRTSADR
jgi:hypothetical protein